MRLLALLLVAWAGAGCFEHCDPARCEGAILHTCSLEGNDAGRTPVWRTTTCTGACVVDPAGGAFCSASAGPIPECQQDGDICYQGAAATCHAGYLESSMPCSGACVVSNGAVFCAESSGPVPECQQDGNTCSHGAIGFCRAGYLLSSMPCPSGSACAAAGSCGPTCVLGTGPDPSCPAPADGASSYCSGNTQVDCQCGYAVARADCGSGYFCVGIGGDTRCALSSTRDPRCGEPPPYALSFCDANTLWTCWNGYPVNTQACGANGTCFVDASGQSGGCMYQSM